MVAPPQAAAGTSANRSFCWRTTFEEGLETRILAITTHALIESVANYGLATFGSHITKKDENELDAILLNRAARRVIGTGITVRREILHMLADTRTATNRYILKTANILDRTMRATGTTAKDTAEKNLNLHYAKTDEKDSKKDKEIGNHTITIVSKRQWKSPFRILHDVMNKIQWEISRSSLTPGSSLKTQSSIYMAKDETLTTEATTGHLIYQETLNQNLTTHERALSILRNINWTPEVIFDSDLFPAKLGLSKKWEKLKWNEEATSQTSTKESLNRWLTLQSLIIEDKELALGLTYLYSGYKIIKTWGQVMGRLFTDRPRHLLAEGLRASLEEVIKTLESPTEELKERLNTPTTLHISSNYWRDWTTHNIMRWQQYGAPYAPMPNQKSFNYLIQELTNNQAIETIYLLPLKHSKIQLNMIEEMYCLPLFHLRKQKQQQMQNLPVFWATQAEVKEKLKLQQEKHELNVIHCLAERTDKKSLTSQILLLWELDRGKIRTILRFLADNRKLPTTFSSMVGATRFKQIVGNKLTPTVCPKCDQCTDTWEHLLQCYDLKTPKDTGKEKIWLEEVKAYLETIQKGKPEETEEEKKGGETEDATTNQNNTQKQKDKTKHNKQATEERTEKLSNKEYKITNPRDKKEKAKGKNVRKGTQKKGGNHPRRT